MKPIITTDEKLEALIFRALQKVNISQRPASPEPSANVGSTEAKKILGEIWGSPVSDSLFYKLSWRGELPSGRIGKRLVFNRAELIEYAQSRIKKPKDSVSDAVSNSAKQKLYRNLKTI